VGVRENAMFDASFCDAILDPKLDVVRELRVPVSCGQLKSKNIANCSDNLRILKPKYESLSTASLKVLPANRRRAKDEFA
jgi:hypothetical protein